MAKTVVLTGAGISKAAGLSTYRGPGGLWNDPGLAELVQAEALRTRRAEACAMFWTFRNAVRAVEPTLAHRVLAAREVMVVTQNIDSLHTRAGSTQVAEYHGSLAHWRCETCGRRIEPEDGPSSPVCCGELMRPDTVLFGEMIPALAEHTVKRWLRDCELFVAIGTSGTVWPAAGFARSARYSGARTVLLNLEAPEVGGDFDEIYLGPSDETVPKFFGSV